ncbi:unnamed protein product [Rotaria sp. Silwood2]|nr:unnamed protein product [Rotaria sp. Silwood2]
MVRNKHIRLTIIICITSLMLSISLFSGNNIRDLLSLETSSNLISISLWNPKQLQTFQCPVRGDKWIVVTTIFYPTKAIYKFLNLTTQWNLIVIGDQKTPKDWLLHLSINSSRLIYLSIEQQNTLDFRILHYLPYGSYARKNLGYLTAIKCGAKIIFESDDDNLLETNDIYFLPKIVQQKHVPWIGFHRQRSPFINIYG